jgi:large subunit ribosomal protein L1
VGGFESREYHTIYSHMPKRGKTYRNALKKITEREQYSLREGIKLLKESSGTAFDSTAEVHFNLNLDPKKQDQALRGTLILPHGSGKTYKIGAVVGDDQIQVAKEAGADKAGLEEMITEFEKGKIDYDIIVATPDVMKHMGKVAKVLGQKGLMPNPKSGTVTDDIEKTIQELKRGRIEYRNDKEGNVHSIFGKVSFKEDELENNLKSFVKVIRESRPASVKGVYIKSIFISGTMGPGIRLNLNEVMNNL